MNKLIKSETEKPVQLLRAGVLGDGLGALGHGVLGELPGQHQAHGGLDLPGGDRGPGRRQG